MEEVVILESSKCCDFFYFFFFFSFFFSLLFKEYDPLMSSFLYNLSSSVVIRKPLYSHCLCNRGALRFTDTAVNISWPLLRESRELEP